MEPLPLNQVLCGDNRVILPTLPSDSVDLCVTSPPYWGLRDYGGDSQIWGGDPNCEHEWGDRIETKNNYRQGLGGTLTNSKEYSELRIETGTVSNHGTVCVRCGAWKGSLGLEPHPQLYVDHLVEICREVKRVIKPKGSFWLNLGDTYYGSGKGAGTPLEDAKEVYIMDRSSVPKQNIRSNWLQPKQLLGIPWRVATALQDDGWILRNCVIWFKPNHMPESVRDRLTKSYEFFFFFVKSKKYYFDLDAIRIPQQTKGDYADYSGKLELSERSKRPEVLTRDNLGKPNHKNGKNPGDVLTKHELATSRIGNFSYDDPLHNKAYHENGKNPGDFWEVNTQPFPGSHFAVFPPELIEPIIKSSSPPNGVVMDTFAGSGTALRVARKLGRSFIGIELNPEYAAMCEQRVRADTYTKPPEGVPTLTEMFEK